MTRRCIAWMCSMGALVACGSSLRTVPTGSAPPVAPFPIDFLPPPAKVEAIPPDPGAPCQWLDGRWEWIGENWEWKAGRWVWPMEDCVYSVPMTNWVSSTVAYYSPGQWYSPATGAGCPEPAACRVPTAPKSR